MDITRTYRILATGGDWRASVLNIICIIISIIMYYPFVKMYDKKLLAEEVDGEGNII
ncbi:hypothetical protein [Clostridium sp.]|uniref:hypothetical protein n=1 Tax=Clostridium sp. TaxID=1506 RepID=UPI003FA59DE2